MAKESSLKNKVILVVDDELDILETVEEELDMCILHKAQDYDTAEQYLASYTYDIVILDIMGVDGFELLKNAVNRGFPTTMLTAHALTPEALKQSIKLGAVFFLPKERLFELKDFLETNRAIPEIGLSFEKSGVNGLAVNNQPNWKTLEKNPISKKGISFPIRN